MRTFKICSFSNFQIYNAVLLTIVTVLYIIFLHPIILSLITLTYLIELASTSCTVIVCTCVLYLTLVGMRLVFGVF